MNATAAEVELNPRPTASDEATELCFLPATELAARIRRHDLSPVEVVGAYLDRIERRNPHVNAYTLILAEQAMDAARAAERAVMAGGRSVRCTVCLSA